MPLETRRFFIKKTALALGLPLFGGNISSARNSKPLKAILIRDKNALKPDGEPDAKTIHSMIQQGICHLTCQSSHEKAWLRLFPSKNRIAIKSNVSVRPVDSSIHHAIIKSISDSRTIQPEFRIWDRNRGGTGMGQIEPHDWTWIPGYGEDSLSHAIHWADGLINTPILKTHPLTGLSGAVKNWAGAVTNINRRDDRVTFSIHANEGANLACIPALPQIRSKNRLIVMDALKPLYQTDSGDYSSWPYRGLILGTDPVAVDRIGWEIVKNYLRNSENQIGKIIPEPKHLQAASSVYQLGSWNMEENGIQIIGWKHENFLT